MKETAPSAPELNDGPTPRRPRRWLIVLGLIVVLFLFVFLYIAAIIGYAEDTGSRIAVVESPKPKTPDYIAVQIKVLSINLNEETMQLRVGLTPEGSYSTPIGELSEDLHLIIGSSTGGIDRTFKKDEFMSPADATVELQGIVSDYPWDVHKGLFGVTIIKPQVSDSQAETVPAQTTLLGSIAGVAIDANVKLNKDDDGQTINMRVTRSAVVKAVVFFAMGLLWILTITVLAMVIAVLVGNKIEMVMFPFIGTILFSMVAFRNALPGAPPIGAISDYLAFFWGYALCVLALLALMITWLMRLPRKPRRRKAPG